MLGRRGDQYGGYISLGRNALGPRVYGALYYDRDGRGHRRPHHYRCDQPYFRGYRPIRHFGWHYYEPWYGYNYSTVYTPFPYVYRYYDTDVYDTDIYYVDQPEHVVYEIEKPGDGMAGPRVEAREGPPVTGETYPVLTESDDSTLIGQGNAAFLARRYDEARRLYSTAMLADERDGYAKFLYALANFAADDYDVAGLALRRALMTTSELIDYPVDVRALYPDGPTFETQLNKLIGYLGAHPGSADSLLLLGYLHYAGGDPERALAVLTDLAASASNDDLVALLRDAVARVVERGGTYNDQT
jgi:tetratricopeptide (TPR) repeat protein